jgi:hypothetical protein
MNRNLLGLICAVGLCLPAFQKASAQSEYKKLTPDDFQGTPRTKGDGVVAYTNCTIDFHYEAHPKGNYYVLNFNIKVTMNKNRSWLNRSMIRSQAQMAQILRHEQGHYTVAYMEQQELLRTVGKTVFYSNYQQQAQAIFDRIDAKYKQLNLDYDTDTEHMVNHVQQASWNTYFDRKLAYMPPVNEG